MDVYMMKGCSRVCGEGQGFIGLPLIDEIVPVEGIGPVCMMTSAWLPNEEDLAKLNAGGTIRVRIWGAPDPRTGVPIPAPMNVGVADKEEDDGESVQVSSS